VPMAVPVPARCPNIHGAVEALRSAKQELEEARHDFCGHRKEALEAIDHSLHELHEAEECDRCR
jgi:hypothetical protein